MDPPRDPAQQSAQARPVLRDSATESRRETLHRKARRARLYAWIVIALVLLGVLIALVAANARQVRLDWVVGSGDASLVWIIFVASAIGWLLGLATSVIFRRRTRASRGG